jgi:thioredoxin 1
MELLVGLMPMEEDKELEKIKEMMLKRIMEPADPSPWENGTVNELSIANFDNAIGKARLPVLVDFWAGWCAPCMVMKPVMEAMAREYSGKAHFAKVDVDRNQALARRYGVMSIPNFVIFRNGGPVDRIVGVVGRSGLETALKKHLG